MKVSLKDMTLEGNPDEIFKFLSLRENTSNNNVQEDKNTDGYVIGTMKNN
ncbi:hypothetical protein ACOSZF_23385 [Cytobacillus firmus]